MAQRSNSSKRIPTAVIEALMTPVQAFIKIESASGIVLVAAAAVAFAWSNSPWAESYFSLRGLELGIELGAFTLRMDLLHWVNELLMAIFFLLVGVEIKRELLVGELDTWKEAALPVAGALGGIVIPALIYAGLNLGQASIRGWGIPMATDIAFALGVLALLGDRVPLLLKVFLLGLAIVDDLAAVLVIAIFYTHELSLTMLLLSLGVWALAIFYGRADGRRPLVYAVLGLAMWYCMHESGVHAVIAGVLLAWAIPLRHGVSLEGLRDELRAQAGARFEEIETRMGHLEALLQRARSPLHRTENILDPYVAFLIMPIFAFFNAGVAIGGGTTLVDKVSAGAFLGLLIGKPLGVLGFVWLAVTAGLARLPDRVSWRQVSGIGLLAGIGFTMSLFIANLAFRSGNGLDQAKIGVLAASTAAALLGLTLLHYTLPRRGAADTRAEPTRS